MPQYNYQTGQYEETDEERQAREAAEKRAGTTVVGETKVKQYQDGSQTETVTKEVPAPSFIDRMGQAVQQAGTNFVNNVAAAPERFAQNVQAIPGQIDQRVMNIANQMAPSRPLAGFQGQTDEFGGVDQAIARQAQMPAAPAPQAQPPAQPVAPQPMNQQAYNANIARQESGANPNIGYHDRSKGTAFGTYGITDAAYADARRANPALPADKTQATREQQTAAMNAFTQQNARYLQNYGIEPTQNNLAAAHFLGAKGLADYMRDGTISPGAAAANGGEEKVRQIVNARLGGQAAPASGAINQPAPQAAASPYSLSTGISQTGLGTPQQRMAAAAPVPMDVNQAAINRYQQIQDQPEELFKFAFSREAPEYLKQRAKDSLVETYDREKKLAQATKEAENLTPKQAADAIQGRSKSGVGDWLQYLLLRHVGLSDLANQKGEELGIGHAWQNATVTDENGVERSAEIQTTASGKVLGGNYTGSTTPLTPTQLEQATGNMLGKGVHISKVLNLIDPETKQLVTHQILSNGKERFLAGGKPFAGDRTKLQDAGENVKQEDRRVNAGYANLSKLTAVPTQQQKYDALRMAGVSPERIEQELGAPAGSLARPGAGGAPAAAAPAPAATNSAAGYIPPKTQAAAQNPAEEPVQRPGEDNQVFKRRLSTWENKNKLQQKDAEAFVTKATDVRSTLSKFKDGIDVIKSGAHNLGPNFTMSGAGPLPRVQQFFGEQFGTDAADNTKMLRSLITRGGLEGIKNYMGPAISNFDVETWMKNNPITETSTPQAINAWLTKTHNAMLDAAEMQRKNAVDKGMLEPGFTLGSRIGETTEPGVTSSGNKYKRVQ